MQRRRGLQLLAAAAGMPLPLRATAASSRIDPALPRLADLSLATLRNRAFEARYTLEEWRTKDDVTASYISDGLRVYARIQMPGPDVRRPATGWPVILYAHGWVGLHGALGWHFERQGDGLGADLLARFAAAGHVVVVPGFRGHGTVHGVPAEGREWIEAYDNGSYLSPLFYAVDLLHALAAVPSLETVLPGLHIDPARLHVAGHSQGGDVALAALAVASRPGRPQRLAAGALWAGCFEGRVEQGEFYGAMEGSVDALADPRFLGVMPHWWQPSMYGSGGIEAGQRRKREQMLQTLQRHVVDARDVRASQLATLMAPMDAIKHPQFIQAPLQLHHSDRDHYSPPAWNAALARRVNEAGGRAEAHLYPGNTHDFRVQPGWSPPGSRPGRSLVAERTLAHFG